MKSQRRVCNDGTIRYKGERYYGRCLHGRAGQVVEVDDLDVHGTPELIVTFDDGKEDTIEMSYPTPFEPRKKGAMERAMRKAGRI